MVPSLQSICGVPALVVISNHPEVKKQIFSSSTYKLYKICEERVRWENAINQQTSEILKEYNPVLKSIFPRLRVKFVGIEMLRWTETQQRHFDLPLKFSQDFIKSSLFTSKGFIDEEKAARELVKEQSLSLLLKYKIACHFFLRDVIPNLWQELQTSEPIFKNILSELSSKTPMVMWSNYLTERKRLVQNKPFIPSKFKAKAFSYGMKNKNVAAVKFGLDPEGEFRKSEKKRSEENERLSRSFENYVRWAAQFFFPFRKRLSFDVLLSRRIMSYCNFIEYVISTMDAKELLISLTSLNDSDLVPLKWFLHWPHQYQFMNIAQIAFNIMNEQDYYFHLLLIVSFIREKNVSSPYNYSLLLREFWIKSPTSFKKYVIDKEAGEYFTDLNEYNRRSYELITTQLLTLRQFTSDDMQNVYLIVKEASQIKKKKIFQLQGEFACGFLCMMGSYKRANFFFNVLELDQDTVKAFKKEFAFDYFDTIIDRLNMECVSEEFLKWLLGTDEIDELKDEIFYKLTRPNKFVHLFDFSTGSKRFHFEFVDNILKLFLKTNEKIEEWKKTLLLNVDVFYSPLIHSKRDWMDNLLMYLDISEAKKSEIKRDLLMRNLSKIAKSIYEEEIDEKSILFLCLYEKERIRNFTNKLHAFYTDSVANRMCILCMNNNHVTSNGDNAQLQCLYHGTNGFIDLNNVNEICSSFLDSIHKALENTKLS